MSPDFGGILSVAALFFLVTMGLAVGPLLLCRLFTRTPESCKQRPQPANSFVPWLLSACGTLIAIGVAVVVSYFTLATTPPEPVAASSNESATVAAEDSLFEPAAHSHAEPVAVHRTGVRLTWMAILLPVLIVGALLALAGQQTRRGLVALVPLALVGAALFLFVARSSVQTVQVTEGHGESIATTRSVTATMAPQSVVSQAPEAPHVVTQPIDVTPPIDSYQIADATTPPPPPTPTKNIAPEESPVVEQTPVAKPESIDKPAVMTYVGTEADGTPRDSLPDWTRNTSGDGPIRVIESGLHATVKLAEQHALAQLRTLLDSEFERQHPEARGWEPDDEVLLASGSILHRAVERSQIQVGEFTTPMYEAYWQVDTSNIAPLYEAWRPSVVEHRLVWLGGGLALLTLLLGSVAGVLRVDEQTQGQRRKSLAVGTLALWAAIGGAVLLMP